MQVDAICDTSLHHCIGQRSHQNLQSCDRQLCCVAWLFECEREESFRAVTLQCHFMAVSSSAPADLWSRSSRLLQIFGADHPDSLLARDTFNHLQGVCHQRHQWEQQGLLIEKSRCSAGLQTRARFHGTELTVNVYGRGERFGYNGTNGNIMAIRNGNGWEVVAQVCQHCWTI